MIVTMTVKMMMNPICRDAARKVATRSTVSQLGPEQQKCIQFADKEAVKDRSCISGGGNTVNHDSKLQNFNAGRIQITAHPDTTSYLLPASSCCSTLKG